MLNLIGMTSTIDTRSQSLAGRGRRRVVVRVLDGAREVDRFQSSSGDTLRRAVRPVYRHLAKGRMRVVYTGVEESESTLGMRRSRREVALRNFGDALLFLAA